MLIVPFTFIDAAKNALKYAIALGSKIEMDLVLFHATESGSTSEEKMDALKAALHSEIDACRPPKDVTITAIVAKGDYEEQIERFANNYDVRGIVVGTRTVSGLQKVLHEGRTARFLNNTTLPTLVIPEGYEYKPYKYILFASDFKPIENDDALDPIVNMAKVYDAEVRIAHVSSRGEKPDMIKMNEINREAFIFGDGVKHSFKHIHRSTVSKGINHYLNIKGDNDVLVFVKRKKGFLDSLFRKENSLEFAVNPKLPVLILHEEARKKWKKGSAD
jgi:nucleotide-binding universal stress UspA family protein